MSTSAFRQAFGNRKAVMDRRVPKWLIGLVALFALVGARWTYDQRQDPRIVPDTGPLVEGVYRVVQVEDSLTLIVEKEPDPDTAPDTDPDPAPVLRVRLGSLVVTDPEPATRDPRQSFALAKLLPSGRVTVRFDRTRFGPELTPLAYVFHEGDLINAELAAQGVAEPRLVPGNSASLQRQIQRAAERRR